MAALVGYLRNSHVYFLDFRLPAIRRKLIEAIDCSHNDVAFAILRFFDEYVAEVHKHMDYEEQKVFPYVEGLLRGEHPEGYSIDIFRRHHDQVEAKLAELKRIIIRYYPSGSTNELNGVLFDIFTCERDLGVAQRYRRSSVHPGDQAARGADGERGVRHTARGHASEATRSQERSCR
mgnify:CR=1 FL=1